MLERRSLDDLYSFEGSGHDIATAAEGNPYAAHTGRRRANNFVFHGLSEEGR